MISPAVKWRNRLITLVAFAAIWEIAGRTIHSLLLPTFTETSAAFLRLLVSPALWDAFWVSNQALVIGYAAALVVGVPLGVWMGSSRLIERITGGYLTIILMTPTAALLPLIIVAVGLNLTARVMVVFLFAVPFVILNTRAGLIEVDRSLIEMARSFCATRWQLLWQTVLPAAMPGIMLGARVGLGRAIAGMVMVELLLIAVGLGRLLLNFQAKYQAGSVYAVILVILLEAVVLMKLTRWLEQHLMPWSVKS